MFAKAISTVWKREVKSYFYTSLGYVFIGMFTLLMGFMFYSFLATYEIYSAQSTMGMAPAITIDRLAEAFYGNLHVILMFTLPFFTMRLFTEESRQNTLALLMTSPITTFQLALAKFVSAATMLLLLLGVTLIFPMFLQLFSAAGPNAGPDWGILLTTYVGLFFAGMAYMGFGIFWSSVTDSPLVALMLSFATNFGFWLLSLLAQGVTGTAQDVLKHLAINEQFVTFAKGTVELQSVVYFITVIAFSLFLTYRSLESRAWRS